MTQSHAIFAYMVEEENGREGIVAAATEGHLFPLVSSIPGVLEKQRHIAVGHAKASGRPVRLARFDNRVDLDLIEPD